MIWYDIYDIWYDMIRYMIRYKIWYDTIWYMIRYDIRYDTIYDTWYDKIWYDMVWYDIWNDMLWYDMIHLLTAFGLTPIGSSTIYFYTQTIHRTTQWNKIPRTEHT